MNRVFALCLLCFCMATSADAKAFKVFDVDFGKDWPLTVTWGTVDCFQIAGWPALTFRVKTSGPTYALNGIAIGHAKKYGWRDITEIWKDDPEMPWAKISIQPLIERARKACD